MYRLLAWFLCCALYGAAHAENAKMQIGSTAFSHNGAIPAVYTCDGHDTSPPLSWTDVPSSAKSLVLIVDDPDAPDPAAPRMTWVHWVLYNLPPNASSLAEGADTSGLPPGAKVGLNDWKRAQYGGPCPPVGRHRYVHKLYALDIQLSELRHPTKADVETAMRGHVLAEAKLIGTYQKGG
jgi:Raf kinase inhibitor-like YbhB/YbcL family protein